MAKNKITNALLNSLAIISIIGFFAIIGNAWLNFKFLSLNTGNIMLLVLGGGLIVEGKLKEWKKFRKNGISNNEIAHIITGLVGLIALITGLIGMFGFNGSTLEATKAIIASIAIIVIAAETWVVKN